MSAVARPRLALRHPLPPAALHIVLVAVGAGLSVLLLSDVAVLVGVGLTLAAVARPRFGTVWALIALLGLGQLLRDPASVGPELLLVVAGVHALAVLGGLVAVIPPLARIEAGALLRPLRTALLIQVPAQIAAVLALLVRGAVALPFAAVLGGLLLLGLALILLGTGRRGILNP